MPRGLGFHLHHLFKHTHPLGVGAQTCVPPTEAGRTFSKRKGRKLGDRKGRTPGPRAAGHLGAPLRPVLASERAHHQSAAMSSPAQPVAFRGTDRVRALSAHLSEPLPLQPHADHPTLCERPQLHRAVTLQDSPAILLLSKSDCRESLSRTKAILALRSERPTSNQRHRVRSRQP